MIKARLVGDWAKAIVLVPGLAKQIPLALNQSILREGQYLVGRIKERISKGPHKPLARAPRMSGPGKGGSKPLIAGGDLLGSVAMVPRQGRKGLMVFVGVPRSGAGRGAGGKFTKGKNIAAIHEFGATIAMRLTPKMRKFLFGFLFKGEPKRGPGRLAGSGIIVIHIPARPFIRPVFEAEKDKAPVRVMQHFAKLLNGALGKA